MKTTFLVLLFCILFCISAFSQEAKKIDEFENIPCDEYLARIDNAIIQASDNPSSSIYVLIYEGKELKYNSRKKKTELVSPNFGSGKAKIRSMKEYILSKKFPIEDLRLSKPDSVKF